jgi:GTP pyrophosphokinase
MYTVSGRFEGDDLHLTEFKAFETMALDSILNEPGPWVLGLDVPFSLPNEFVAAQGWPGEWAGYVATIGAMTPGDLTAVISAFRQVRAEGMKEPRRPTDIRAGALSPLKVANPPLLRMFQAAAPILAASACDVVPFRNQGRDRVVVEVYPKLVAKRLRDTRYKTRSGDASTRTVRREMLEAICAGDLTGEFGFRVHVGESVAAIAVANQSGDAIDSVFSAIEAAWVFRNREQHWGIPDDGRATEGWIVDPRLAHGTARATTAFAKAGAPPASRFEQAMGYAFRAHCGQTRKGTLVPYVSHLLLVAGLVLEFGGGEEEAIGALLHDVVEDAGGLERLADVRTKFGDRVAAIVAGCTDAEVVPKPPWRRRKENYLAHLEHADHSTRLVSAADNLANVRSTIQDYRTIGEELWSRFTGTREETFWYYRGLAQVFTRLGPSAIAGELAAAVAELDRLSGRDN